MRFLRIVIGLPLALFALAYMAIGSLFMTSGPPYDAGAGRVLALTGLLGFSGPVVLFGLHLAFSGPTAPLGRRSVLLGALLITLCVGLVGSVYAFSQHDMLTDAADMLFTILISTGLFGWPIIAARIAGSDN